MACTEDISGNIYAVASYSYLDDPLTQSGGLGTLCKFTSFHLTKA